MPEFKLTVEEANILDKIAEATKMDCWFRIDENLHVQDIEEDTVSSDAEGVCLLEDGLAYGLDEPQSGALSPEEIKVVEACFKRARAAKDGREIVVKCDDESVTVQNPQGLTDVIDAVISLYRDSEVTFQEFLEMGKLEIVGLTLCEQAMVFAELKRRLDGDEVTIEGHDGEYGRMDLVDYLTKGPAPRPEERAPAAPSTPSSSGYLTIEQILGIISGLAKSQGSYGRLLEEILDSKRENPKAYEEWARGMEAKNFADALEVALFFEEGKLPKACPKAKYWSVPVVYEMYGSISVEASSAEEAYDQVKEHPEDFGLPDEAFYVDDNFRVSDDDRENAVETIRMLSCVDEDDPVDEAASGRHTGLTVKATVTFQRWEGDVARFNGEAEFDACDALDSFDDEMIALIEHGDPNAYDAVYYEAVRLGQIHDYDGPFEVDLDEDNLSDYLEARKEGK